MTEQNKQITVPLFSAKGEDQGTLSISQKIVPEKDLSPVVAQYVRVYSTNQRQGNASTKTRAQVAGTTKKVYKQKGTGRARHGSMKAPIFKGGGVVGGPKPKEYKLSLTKNQKKRAFQGAFYYQLLNKRVVAVEEELFNSKPKTAFVHAFLQKIGFAKKRVLIVLPQFGFEGFVLSSRNIPEVQCSYMGLVNTMDILRADKIIISDSTLKSLESYLL